MKAVRSGDPNSAKQPPQKKLSYICVCMCIYIYIYIYNTSWHQGNSTNVAVGTRALMGLQLEWTTIIHDNKHMDRHRQKEEVSCLQIVPALAVPYAAG